MSICGASVEVITLPLRPRCQPPLYKHLFCHVYFQLTSITFFLKIHLAGLVQWFNWLIFHLQMPASYVGIGSCSDPVPCLWCEEAAEKTKALRPCLSHGRPGRRS